MNPFSWSLSKHLLPTMFRDTWLTCHLVQVSLSTPLSTKIQLAFSFSSHSLLASEFGEDRMDSKQNSSSWPLWRVIDLLVWPTGSWLKHPSHGHFRHLASYCYPLGVFSRCHLLKSQYFYISRTICSVLLSPIDCELYEGRDHVCCSLWSLHLWHTTWHKADVQKRSQNDSLPLQHIGKKHGEILLYQ